MVRAVAHLPDADRAVLHLDHDRLLRLDPERTRRSRHHRWRVVVSDLDADLYSGGHAALDRRNHLRFHDVLGAISLSAGVYDVDGSAGASSRHHHYADQG